MTRKTVSPLKHLLSLTQDMWDRDTTRSDARAAFGKVIACGTAALGAEVFASAKEERVVYHTCKSRACPSCGHRATIAWQRDLWSELPDVPYAHVCLTMPDVLWPLFRQNRHLLHDLPVLGARVIQVCAKQQGGVRLMIVVVPHTFGRHLNFNCHLHILISQGGVAHDKSCWRSRAMLDRTAVMRTWRYAVIAYLQEAVRAGILSSDLSAPDMHTLLDSQGERAWIVDVKRFQTKTHFLAYAGRYARRPPIAQHRFRHVDRQAVRFVTKDTRTKRVLKTEYGTAEFLDTLAAHIPDRYKHNIRYFGLLAPRVKCEFHDRIFAMLGQARRRKPARLAWEFLMKRSFGADPLVDSTGEHMRWARRLPPARSR
jgi:hypothetical protein